MPKFEYVFVITLIAIPIIIIKLLLALYEWYTDWKLLRIGSETTGSIVDEARYDPCVDEGTDSPSYSSHFFAEYTVGSNTYRILSRFIGKKHALLGQQYIIIYNPEKPERARFKCDNTPIWPVRIYLIALFIFLGIFIYGLVTLNF